MTENKKYVNDIREELRAYYDGRMFAVDGNEPEEIERSEAEALEESGATVEELSSYDYLNDVLDVEYILDSSFRLIGVKLYITLGGPTVWIDTRLHTVELRWGGDSETAYLDAEICEEINAVYEDEVLMRMGGGV